MHKFRKICSWKCCFYLLSHNCLSLSVSSVLLLFIFLSLNNTTCPPYTQAEIQLNPLPRLIWWTKIFVPKAIAYISSNEADKDFCPQQEIWFALSSRFSWFHSFSYCKLISAVYIWCSGSTIVGIGSPDPPQFIYDDNEYEDVFLSGKTYVIESIVC